LPWLPETVLAAFGFAALRRAMKASARGNTFEPSELDRYAQAWENPGSLTSMLNYYRSLRERRVGEPTRIASPTLMLSERDSFLGEHVARASLGLCDDGRLRIIAGATHWLHLEEPRRINTEFIPFYPTIAGLGMQSPPPLWRRVPGNCRPAGWWTGSCRHQQRQCGATQHLRLRHDNASRRLRSRKARKIMFAISVSRI
jgi:hypothetical protein